MYPSVGYCSINMRFLAEDDKQGAEYLYPSAATNSPPVATISSPTDGVVSAETVLTFAGSATDAQDGDIGANLVWTSNVDGQIGTGKSFQRALSAGAHLITASVTDSNGATTQAQRSLSVEATTTTTTPPSGGIQVTANAYKVKGVQRVDLLWTGTAAGMIDIYRNGSRLTTTPNTGRYTDGINKKGNGSYLYTVCEAGDVDLLERGESDLLRGRGKGRGEHLTFQLALRFTPLAADFCSSASTAASESDNAYGMRVVRLTTRIFVISPSMYASKIAGWM